MLCTFEILRDRPIAIDARTVDRAERLVDRAK